MRSFALKTPAVGYSLPVTADTNQQALICLHSPCRATPFISVYLEHQTGTFTHCVQSVPSLVLTRMVNGWVDKGSVGSQGPRLPTVRPLISKSKLCLTLIFRLPHYLFLTVIYLVSYCQHSHLRILRGRPCFHGCQAKLV